VIGSGMTITLGVISISPTDQLDERQRRPSKFPIQPDAEIMQRHLGGNPGGEPAEFVGPFPVQAEHVMQAAVHRLDHLADSRQPTAPSAGPGFAAVPLRRGEHLRPVVLAPARVPVLAIEPLVGHVGDTGG